MGNKDKYAAVFPMTAEDGTTVFVVGSVYSESGLGTFRFDRDRWYLRTSYAYANREDAESEASNLDRIWRDYFARLAKRERTPSRWRRFKMRLGIA